MRECYLLWLLFWYITPHFWKPVLLTIGALLSAVLSWIGFLKWLRFACDQSQKKTLQKLFTLHFPYHFLPLALPSLLFISDNNLYKVFQSFGSKIKLILYINCHLSFLLYLILKKYFIIKFTLFFIRTNSNFVIPCNKIFTIYSYI